VHGVRNSLTPQHEQQLEAMLLMSISTVAPPTHSLRIATEIIASTAGPTTVNPPGMFFIVLVVSVPFQSN
jgi:hypothetical protein